MSLIDEVHEMQQRVLARLRELEPLVAEHRELSELARQLGIETARAAGANEAAQADASNPPVARASRSTGPAQGKRRRSGATRAARSAGTRRKRGGPSREEQVLAEVRANPGITVAQLGKKLEVDATALYRPVRKLAGDGSIVKRGLQLHPE